MIFVWFDWFWMVSTWVQYGFSGCDGWDKNASHLKISMVITIAKEISEFKLLMTTENFLNILFLDSEILLLLFGHYFAKATLNFFSKVLLSDLKTLTSRCLRMSSKRGTSASWSCNARAIVCLVEAVIIRRTMNHCAAVSILRVWKDGNYWLYVFIFIMTNVLSLVYKRKNLLN